MRRRQGRSQGEVEIGALTKGEFLALMNPSDKHHPESAYDVSLEELNRRHPNRVGETHVGSDRAFVEELDGVRLIMSRDDARLIGLVDREGAGLYEDPRLSRFFPRFAYDRDARVDLGVKRLKQVKYLAEHDPRRRPSLRGFSASPLQTFAVGGERFRLLSEGDVKKNAGTTLALVNDEGFIVAMASDEWGATLLRVAKEYRRKGLGVRLLAAWQQNNPKYESGGFTPSGERGALRLWQERVRTLSAEGFYSKAVRARSMSLARARRILDEAGLSRATLVEPGEPKAAVDPATITRRLRSGDLLIYFDGTTFVVYDKAFLDRRDERFIHGFGFFRDVARIGPFVYRIDYDRPYAALTTRVALQAARDAKERLYVGGGYDDMIEYEGIPGARRRGDHLLVERDLLPLKELATLERRIRVPRDPYRENYNALLEMAESKWS